MGRGRNLDVQFINMAGNTLYCTLILINLCFIFITTSLRPNNLFICRDTSISCHWRIRYIYVYVFDYYF
jgi:hypothetical protein